MWESKSNCVIERESDDVKGSLKMLHLQRSCNSLHKFETKHGAKDEILNVERESFGGFWKKNDPQSYLKRDSSQYRWMDSVVYVRSEINGFWTHLAGETIVFKKHYES